MTAPERSLKQRLDALAEANRVRVYRADVKRDLKAGRLDFITLLQHGDRDLATAKLLEFLLCIPKVGRVKATKVLNDCRVSPSKTLGGLSERQRGELVRALSRTPAPVVTIHGPQDGRLRHYDPSNGGAFDRSLAA